MFENYEFRETSSRTVNVDGQQMRMVNFGGNDTDRGSYNYINADGAFTMPLMDYFMAGVDGNLEDIIRETVINRLGGGSEEEGAENEETNDTESGTAGTAGEAEAQAQSTEETEEQTQTGDGDAVPAQEREEGQAGTT